MSGRKVREIAAERGIDDDFEALVGIVLADDFRTVLWPRDPRDNLTGNLGEDFPAYADVWQKEDVLLGGSDGGAHLDRMCGAPYVTRFLGDCVRGRQVLGLERAVQLISDAPARLYGLRDRGRIPRATSPISWCSIPPPSTPARRPWCTTFPAAACACSPIPSACIACSSTASRPSPTEVLLARPQAPCCAPVATPTQ